MERSVGLNPASMPFLPGAFRGDDAGGNLPGRWHDRASISSLSISPSEYRSARSSPSPPIDNRDTLQGPPNEWSRLSPTVRQTDAVKSHAAIEGRVMKEVSSMGSLDTLHEGDDSQETPVPLSGEDGTQTPGSSSFASQQRRQRSHEFVPTPPASVIYKSPSVHGDPTSASPVSSLDSGSHFSSAGERQGQSFEEQLKTSPIIHDILSRLVQCEFFTREIQRDLGEVHRQVNLLVERSLGVHSQPNFKDPFASAKTNGNSFSSPPLNGPRPSMGSIAPNQSIPTDDVTTISQRLNTLTSSVGQLLAIQTQQMQATNADLRSNSIIGLNTIRGDIAPNQVIPPPMMPNSNILGHGLPRPEVGRPARHPGPPMRTWSAGNLELPARPSDNHVGRQENIPRDKRRSVTGLLRRESSGIIETQSDSLGAGSPRDSGPVISKWEQLSLAPDLLRSLSKFGVGPPNKIQQRALPFLLRGSDIIAQAPPTQERIAAYVIPAIQIALTNISVRSQTRGPIVIMISTTVDQATQAQRMIRDLGGPIGVRSALGVGVTSANSELSQELRLLQQNMPHIICGTPQKLHALFTSPGGLVGSEVRFLVLDEVDQLIARNLHEFVFNIVKVLPPPRSRPVGTGTPTPGSTANNLPQIPFNNSQEPSNGIVTPLQSQVRRYSVAPAPSSALNETNINSPLSVERQTALFSNTVPQDVLNLASAIQLREPVRVLVRRDGNVAQTEPSQGSRGLRQFYLYLAFTAGGRSDPMAIPPGGGLGIIGSGRGASSAETAQAREWKLDALADLFDDVEVTQAIVHVGGMTALDSVVYKLASRGLEAVPLHGDMNAGTKLAALNKFRNSNTVIIRPPPTKVLVVYDVQVKAPDVSHVPLVINYDLPKAVEEYAHRVAPAVASNYARAGVVVNFVTATGGDVEMLRSIECFYKIKCPEVPMTLRDVV